MSIRVIACFLFVIGFSIYAWRNWFVSLCAAILLMAVIEHPDMPKTIADIQGLNPWNILIANVVLAWLASRQLEVPGAAFPRAAKLLLPPYLVVIFVSFVRLVADPTGAEDYSFTSALSEYLINAFKWIIPGVLLFDGCRTRQRVVVALAVILMVYVLLAVQVVRWMPLSAATMSGAQLSRLANKLVINEIGFHRVNLSMMLSGASWAILCCLVLTPTRRVRLAILAAAAAVILGQVLTGGRMGYVTWAFLGALLSLVRWPRFLLVIPVATVAVTLFLPAVADRMFMGFGRQQGNVVVQTSDYEITSGRSLIWPFVIKEIEKAPVFGYGRQAMQRTGLYRWLLEEFGGGETFPHPHNAYLELLLDNGIVGFVMVIPLYAYVVLSSFRLLRVRGEPLCCAVGGCSFCLVMALLIAAMGSQTFYPREGSVGMWAAIFLMLRVSVERERSLASGLPLFAREPEDGEVILVEDQESFQPA